MQVLWAEPSRSSWKALSVASGEAWKRVRGVRDCLLLPGAADPDDIYGGGCAEPFDRPTGAGGRFYAIFSPEWAKCVVYASWGRIKQRFGQGVRGKAFETERDGRRWLSSHGDEAQASAPLVVIA